MRTSRFRATFRSAGFTLVEVVVALGVFSILVALLLPLASSISKRTAADSAAIADIETVRGAVHEYLITGEAPAGVDMEETPRALVFSSKDGGFAIEVPK